jgi:hypothetical protein
MAAYSRVLRSGAMRMTKWKIVKHINRCSVNCLRFNVVPTQALELLQAPSHHAQSLGRTKTFACLPACFRLRAHGIYDPDPAQLHSTQS